MSFNIIYTYYNNRPRFEWLVDHYKKTNPFQKIIFIDDGSSDPLKKEDVPGHWEIYRITEDVGWNNEGARNLGMHVTDAEWNALLDMEFYFNAEQLENTRTRLHRLDDSVGYRLQRNHSRRSDGTAKTANLFMVTKDVYWKLGGYDESHNGWYGSDVTLKSKLDKTGHHLPWTDNPKNQNVTPWLYVDEINAGMGAGSSGISREQKRASQEEWKRLLAEGKIEMTDEKLRFPWVKI